MRAYDLTVTGSFAISGSDKITFTDAGKLGIGTSNPGAELEIKGIARDTELFVIERFNDTQNFLEFKDVSNDPSLEIFKGDGQTFFKINETGDIFSNIANAKISGSATSTGSFGLVDSDHGIRFGSSGAYKSPASIRANSNLLVLHGGTSGYQFKDDNNAATNMAIDSSGNVGIGTDNPDAHLDVRGSGTQEIEVLSTDGLGRLSVTGATQADLVFKDTGGGTNAKISG